MCDQYGLQKIETVGKTYMACGGLKSAERKIESRLLNRHHSVRVTDFGMEVATYAKSVFLKNGKHLEVRIGIHTGPVISGVVGDTKPQFSLIGDTVNKTSRVCSLTTPLKCSVSKETHHYLELYTNNLFFQQNFVEMKGIGREPIFVVSVFKGNRFVKGADVNNRPGTEDLKTDDREVAKMNINGKVVSDDNDLEKEHQKQKKKIEEYTGNVINDSESIDTQSIKS